MANIFFPLDPRKVSWETDTDQSWDVNEQASASGRRRALTYQTLPGWTFTITFPRLTSEEKDDIFAFFARMKGSLTPFYYKDAENYKCENVVLAKNADGSYQLVANMHGQQEPVYYADNLHVYVDGVKQGDTSYKLDRGAVVFTNAPADKAKVTASYEYYWYVKFAKAKLQIKQRFDNIFQVSLSLEVVR